MWAEMGAFLPCTKMPLILLAEAKMFPRMNIVPNFDSLVEDANFQAETDVPVSWRPKNCDGIGLILQGSGALGTYQASVYQALHEAGLEPTWVSDISIGGINSALIAGNPPSIITLNQIR
jgi:predicted acylesterase/phospholipase RssA